MKDESLKEGLVEVVKALPPVSVATASFMGLSLQEWVYAVTIVYTGFQLFVLIRDKIWRNKDGDK